MWAAEVKRRPSDTKKNSPVKQSPTRSASRSFTSGFQTSFNQ